MDHLNRIVIGYSQELTEGYDKYVCDDMGQHKTGYVSDGNCAFQNQVSILCDLLKPKFDERMKKIFDEFNNELEETKPKLKKEAQNWAEYHRKLTPIYKKLFGNVCEFMDRQDWLIDDQSVEED
jgi:hypothetical protein